MGEDRLTCQALKRWLRSIESESIDLRTRSDHLVF